MITIISREFHGPRERQHLSHIATATATPTAGATTAAAVVSRQPKKVPGQPVTALLPCVRRHVEVGHGGAHVAHRPNRRRLLEERGGRQRWQSSADLEASKGGGHHAPLLVE